MRVFVTGASGFIGSAMVQDLLGAGHQVTGLARSEASAQALIRAGVQVQRGSLDDLDSLRQGAAGADGVIHLAYLHDLAYLSLRARLRVFLGGNPGQIALRFVQAGALADRQAIEALGSALAGSNRSLVAAFGTMGMTPGRLATEDADYDQQSLGGGRSASEHTMHALASRGVRTSVIRLPPMVHGVGDHGFALRLLNAARKKWASVYIGTGQNRWPSVHRLDAARLFRLALERGAAGGTYHGVAEEGVPFREIAQVIGRRAGVPAVSATPRQAGAYLGFLAQLAGIDNPTSSVLTQERLGWHSSGPGLTSDLDQRDYFST
jgi:nucleoside-diphosphate-sugar epimerase